MTNISDTEPRHPKLSSATQELIATLPRVWTRSLLYLLILFAAVAIPWALLTRVDQTGSARGRLEPQGKTIRFDAPVTEAIAKVNVKEGQTVKAGEILVELETQPVLSELQEAKAKLEGQKQHSRQLTQTENQLKVAVLTQQQQNQAEQAEQLAQLAQIRDRLASNQSDYALEQQQAELSQANVQRYQFLQQEGAVSKSKLEEFQSQWLRSQQRLKQAESAIQQSQIELERQQKAYDRILRAGELAVLEHQKQRQEVSTQLTQTLAEITQTQKRIESLEFQLDQRVIKAPIDGTVLHLAANHAGTVLQPGQAIVQIAPKNTPLVLRAQMSSEESGFLAVGMPVRLKFDAYSFQDYGVVEGKLRWVSPDSKGIETAQGKIEAFEIEVELNQSYIQAQGNQINLTAGQTATAEVIIRQRRIIDILLDPFKKLQQGGLEL